MTERDRFEFDLAEALRAYAEEAPTQVHPTELARQFATAYPRVRTRFVPRHRGVTLRLAWVLLLLAGLLIAMVGGMLIVGSQPVPAFICPAGSNPDEPGPVDQARPFGSYEAAFDWRAGRLVALANAGERDGVLPIETWSFDVCTNTWAQMHPDQHPPVQVGNLVYDVDSDVTIGIHYEDWHREPYPDVEVVWVYDLKSDTWRGKGHAQIDEAFCGYDPVSGLVVTELWSYDVEEDAWTPIHQENEPGDGQCTYDVSADRIVAYAGDELGADTWLFDIRTGTWSKSSAETPLIKMGWWAGPTVVYDEAAERTVVAGDFQWGAYDATEDRWEIILAADPGQRLPKPMLYDPVNERLIVRGGEPVPGTGISGDLLAFDLATREWTVLLE